jgi:hypothetical protein
MKKMRMAALAFAVLVSMNIAAQDVTKPEASPKALPAKHTKAIRISGKVSDDGARFVEDANQKVWIVTNLNAMKGFEGQQAVLRGRIGSQANTIQVLSIKGQDRYTANWSDSAFRR